MTYNEIIDAWKHDKIWTVDTKKKWTPYAERKALAKCLAIEWQYELWRETDTWEIFKCQQFFENVGKRYGLLREFKENGII